MSELTAPPHEKHRERLRKGRDLHDALLDMLGKPVQLDLWRPDSRAVARGVLSCVGTLGDQRVTMRIESRAHGTEVDFTVAPEAIADQYWIDGDTPDGDWRFTLHAHGDAFVLDATFDVERP